MESSTVTFACILIFLLTIHYGSAINWNGKSWAMSCDFNGNDLTKAEIRGEDCGGRCASTQGCTHFTWTTWNGGTCWMKQGPVSQNDAFSTNDQSMVCGIISSAPPSQCSNGRTLYNIDTRRHGAVEHGACALPSGNYAVVNPIALGNIDSLQHLKFRPELCGQILNVNCGHESLDIIITNSNLGMGLDLYSSTWEKLTNNLPPGITSCTVQLSCRNAFNFDGPRCYYNPEGPFDNPYYNNVGLLNTNGRLVVKATMDNRPGEHRGSNPYYAFDFGPVDGNKQVIFTFDDGSTHTVFLRDCYKESQQQQWS
ncbi:unnamed protein product [Adineta steineri]|uniref:Apple domain-containing protein n=1 Tax=Adineta steineri TaxID=433720 RepID=A0A819Z580_9BILA|nr:unnamed protein product [Adineta steineri]CAF4168773.1 unnamed protein product [Adineta steineri]